MSYHPDNAKGNEVMHKGITNQQQLMRLLGPTGHLTDAQLEDIAKKRGGTIALRIKGVLALRHIRKKKGVI